MKKLVLMSIAVLFFGFKSGREIDENKMNRDLDIAKNILATLIKGGSDNYFGGNAIEASYIQDYGVVFTIPEHLVYFHSGNSFTIEMPEMPEMPDFDFQFEYNNEDEFLEDAEAQAEMEKAAKATEKEMRKQEKEIQKQVMKQQEQMIIIQEQARETAERAHRDAERAREEIRVTRGGWGDVRFAAPGEEEQINWEEIIITFMTDYADLIGQLQPDDKIIIKQKSPFNENFMVWHSNDGSDGQNEIEGQINGITAEVLRKDIQAYKSGKIDKEAFVAKISIDKKTPPKRNADLEMFTSIFERYYGRDLSETFFAEGRPNYEILDDFGAIVHVRAVGPGNQSRYIYKGDKTTAPDQNQINANDEKLYIEFKESVKSFMLDYGRTVRSLNKDDKLRLEIKINSCSDCQVPNMLEVSADIALLEQYDQQKITKEKALAGIVTNEQF